MRRNISGFTVFFGIFVLLFLTAFINPGFAQNKEANPQLYQFTVLQVKPGMDIEFESLIKNVIPDLKGMGVKEMYISRTAGFGISDQYVIVMPMRDPAAMDSELFATRTSIPIGLVAVRSAIRQMVASSHDFMVIPQPDLNMPLADDYVTKLIVNFTVNIVPGRDEDYKAQLKKVVGALEKTNVKGVLVGKVGFGGNMDQYIVNVFFDSFKDMMESQPAINKELDALKLKPLTGIVNSRESKIFIQIHELCILPAAQ